MQLRLFSYGKAGAREFICTWTINLKKNILTIYMNALEKQTNFMINHDKSQSSLLVCFMKASWAG